MTPWLDRFPGLTTLEASLRDRLIAAAKVVQLPSGMVIFGPGHPPENLLLLLEGRVRVQQITENGREIVLYRVHAGESCVLTTAWRGTRARTSTISRSPPGLRSICSCSCRKAGGNSAKVAPLRNAPGLR
ncbi:cyclic nucleotide-binding domain-containing protein [Paracoccus aurantiacus]|uniref:Cyclic nucleotide-binding domain-containing protein n=1 Tax=Paracoccus aurantiacus TaxID=2599412 RepID=A0A5C6RUH6_9RHOB|nr:cyclic nucleotide-binding domain-containing protein [Paracoccus aurantiacus]